LAAVALVCLVGTSAALHLTPSQPWAVSMWEFSWAERRAAPESEYANWTKVLLEASERGYDVLRIDCMPHLVSSNQTTFTILPEKGNFMWGAHEKVTVEPRKFLVEFISLARDLDVRVACSSWFRDDTTHLRDTVATPADLTRVWNSTLNFLDDAGLLSQVEWVDLCNEFPLGQWLPKAWEYIWDGHKWNEVEGGLLMTAPFPEAVRHRVDDFLTGCIPTLRASWPHLRYTFSMQFLGDKNMQKQNFSQFDMAEVHIWVSDDMKFFMESGELVMMAPVPFPLDVEIFARRVTDLYDKHRDEVLAILPTRVNFWAEWAKKWRLPLVTTECWGPVNYDDVPGDTQGRYWEWVKEVSVAGVETALATGQWLGVGTSNFAEPHFPGMWRDVAWHRNLTDTIRNGTVHV